MLYRFYRMIHRTMGGDHDQQHMRVIGAQAADKIDPIAIRQVHIDHRGLGHLLVRQLPRPFNRGGVMNAIAGLRHEAMIQESVYFGIFNKQYRAGHTGTVAASAKRRAKTMHNTV